MTSAIRKLLAPCPTVLPAAVTPAANHKPSIWESAKIRKPRAAVEEVPRIIEIAKALLRMKHAGAIAELWINDGRILYSHPVCPKMPISLSREAALRLIAAFEESELKRTKQEGETHEKVMHAAAGG